MSNYKFVTREDFEAAKDNNPLLYGVHLLILAERLFTERDAVLKVAEQYADDISSFQDVEAPDAVADAARILEEGK